MLKMKSRVASFLVLFAIMFYLPQCHSFEKQPPQEHINISINPEGNLLEEFDKINNAVSSPSLKKVLAQYRTLIKDHNIANYRVRENMIVENVRNIAYQLDSVSNLAYLIFQMQRNSAKPSAKASSINSTLHELYISLDRTTKHYIFSLELLAENPRKMRDFSFARLNREYTGTEKFYTNFRDKLQLAQSHLELIAKSGSDKLTVEKIWQDLFPQNILNSIKKAKNSQ